MQRLYAWLQDSAEEIKIRQQEQHIKKKNIEDKVT